MKRRRACPHPRGGVTAPPSKPLTKGGESLVGTKGLTRGSAPSTPKRSRAEVRKSAGENSSRWPIAAPPDRRGTAIGPIGGGVSEEVSALHHADGGAKAQGGLRGAEPPLARPPCSTRRQLAHDLYRVTSQPAPRTRKSS